MPSLGVPARLLTGIIVEKTIINVPTGIVANTPICYINSINCCPEIVTVGCCEGVELPSTLYLVFTSVSGCPCFDGHVIVLEWSEPVQGWIGEDSSCGSDRYLLFCDSVTGLWNIFSSSFHGPLAPVHCTMTFGAISSTSCDPLLLEWGEIVVSGCCDGTVTAIVTQTVADVDLECCPDDLLPRTLYLVVTNTTGDCLEGTYALIWSDEDQWWEHNSLVDGKQFSVQLFCLAGSWQLSVACEGDVVTDDEGIAGFTCDPLEINFDDFVGFGECCGADNTLSLVVIE